MGSRAAGVAHLGAAMIELQITDADMPKVMGPGLRALKIGGMARKLADYMEANRGRWLSRQELLVNVFEYSPESKTKTLDVTLSRILEMAGDTEEIVFAKSRHRKRGGYKLLLHPGAEI